MEWKRVRKVIPIIGVALFVYLLIKLDITKVFKEVKNLNPYYFLFAFLLVLLFFITQTLKWFVIARKQKIKIPFKEAFKVNLIGNFYGFVTPSKIGSVMRVDYLKKYGADTGKGLSNFTMDKILDLTSLFILAITFSFLIYSNIVSLAVRYLIIGLFFLMIIFALILYNKNTIKPFLRFINRIFVPKKYKERSEEVFNSFYKDLPSPGFLFLVLVMNIINWIIDYAGIYMMGRAVGINVGFEVALAIFPISTLVAQIPITISGLGTRELTMIGLFGMFGIEAVKVLSMSILNLILTSVIPAFFAILFLVGGFKKEKT